MSSCSGLIFTIAKSGHDLVLTGGPQSTSDGIEIAVQLDVLVVSLVVAEMEWARLKLRSASDSCGSGWVSGSCSGSGSSSGSGAITNKLSWHTATQA